MKNLARLLTICLLFLSAERVFADDKVAENNDIRIRVKRFTMKTLDTGKIDALFEVTYTSKDDNFKVVVKKIEDKEDGTGMDTGDIKEFTMSYPIHYQDFKKEINNSKWNDGSSKAFTENSLSNVYLWICLVRSHIDDNELAGKILLARSIKVTNDSLIRLKQVDASTSGLFERVGLPFTTLTNINTESYGVRINELEEISKRHEVIVLKRQRLERELKTLHLGMGKKYTAYQKYQFDRKRYEEEIKRINYSIDSLNNFMDRKGWFMADDSLDKLNKRLKEQMNKKDDLQNKLNQEEPTLNEEESKEIVHLVNAQDGVYQPLDVNTVAFVNEFTKSKKGDEVNATVIKLNSAIAQEKAWEDIMNVLGIHDVKTVSLQFERGFLENITVKIERRGIMEIFENTYAIGFSSKINYKNFDEVKLFSQKPNENGKYDYIYLSDIILNYEYLLDNYTRDYCPADTVVYIDFSKDGMPLIELKKERLINIFDTKFYTDVEGLNENKPNGLVQIDVCKRFNLRTIRGKGILPRHNVGFLNYINLCGAITKVEKDDRNLFLRNDMASVNGVIVSPSHATNLDFRRYEYGSFGVELNGLIYDLPDSKTTYYLDLAARYGLTKVVDTFITVDNGLPLPDNQKLKEKDAHTLTIAPKLMIEILAQKRVGFNLTYQLNMSYLYSNNEYKQVVSYAKSDTKSLVLEPNARLSHMLELFVKAEVSKDANGKFFFRGRLFLQAGDINTSFSQAQVGYAYNLFYKK